MHTYSGEGEHVDATEHTGQPNFGIKVDRTVSTDHPKFATAPKQINVLDLSIT